MPIHLRLCENLRAISYAPFYYALAGEHLLRAGLDVELITSPSPSQTGRMLIEGRADVSWGGPMRVMLHHETDPACPLICFGLVVARDPFVLVGRTPKPNFKFQDLPSLHVSIATEVPTPWMMFQDDLSRAGVDPALVRGGAEFSMRDNADALLRGEVDLVQVFEPYVDMLLQQGCHIWHKFSDRGEVAYTSFYTTRGFMTGYRTTCRHLKDGMTEALLEFHAAPSARIASSIHGYFPELPLDALMRIIDRYRTAKLWPRTPELTLAAFLRLKAALVSGGLITHDFPFDLIVDLE
jgi:NitT/TauT family transport system substrate-binding protein